MRTPANAPSALRLGLFWLGIQTVWGALLGISLQARSLQFAGGNALVAYGELAASGAACAAIVQLLVGWLSDVRRQNGSRRIEFYAFGGVAGAVGVAAFYGAQSFTALVAAYVVLQAGINVAIGPYQAIIPDFIETRRTGEASAWMAALQSAGNAIGAVLASFIAGGRALAASIDALLLGTCALTCLHVCQLPDTAPARVRLHLSRAFVDLFISRGFVYAGFFTLVGYLLFYVKDVLGAASIGAARTQSGVLILLFTVVSAAGAALAARPSDRMDRRLVATIGGAIVVAALLLFIACGSIAAAAVATCLAGLGWGVFLVADWALACQIMPVGAAALTMAVWNLALILPQIAAPTMTTAVLMRLGWATGSSAPKGAFSLAIGETLLGIAWLWRLSRCATRE